MLDIIGYTLLVLYVLMLVGLFIAMTREMLGL